MKRILFITVIIIVGCSIFEKDYYPVGVGTFWDYEVYDLNPPTGDDYSPFFDTLYVTITDTIYDNGQTVYQLESEGFYPFWQWLTDTIFIVKTADSLIAEDRLGSNEPVLLALFPLEEGRRWVFWASKEDSVWGEVITKEDVEVKAGSFADCFRIEYFPNRSMDWKWTVWLTPGKGPVKYEYTTGLASQNPFIRRWEYVKIRMKI